jgi:cytoskeleton protein RodZ
MIGEGLRQIELCKSVEHPEAAVGTFGERLRREREMRNISLEQIAAVTKIGTRLLHALEDEQFDQLPGGIFNKGYVRAYAKYIGIDEEQAVAEYLQAAEEAAPGPHGNTDQNAAMRFERAGREQVGSAQRATFPVVPVLVVLALIAGGIGGWRLYRERQLDRRSATTTPDAALHGPSLGPPAKSTSAPVKSTLPQTVSDVTESAKPAAAGSGIRGAKSTASDHNGETTTSQFPAGQPATKRRATTTPPNLATGANNAASSEGATPFELTVRPKDRAWVSIKSDGQFVVRGIIKPPDVKTIRATSEVVFYTGNVGAVEVSFNGKSVPLGGGVNDERVLVFNSRGLLPSSASQ